MRVHIAIGGQETWVVAPSGCVDSDPNGDQCPSKRGGLFQANESSTWQSTTEIWDNTGIYGLGEVVLDSLGIKGVSLESLDIFVFANEVLIADGPAARPVWIRRCGAECGKSEFEPDHSCADEHAQFLYGPVWSQPSTDQLYHGKQQCVEYE